MLRDQTHIHIPEFALVVLIGASSSGKSSFGRKHFKPTEIVSSDACRGMVSDDENSLTASDDAFDLARFITAKRLKKGLLTVIDATNVQPEARKDWVQLAREYHVLPVAIVLNMPENVCEQRNALRTDRNLGKHVIPNQVSQLKRNLKKLKLEGFRHIFEFRSPEQADAVQGIIRDRLYNNKQEEQGPFDLIGDVHGCYDELVSLLQTLEYENTDDVWQHPAGRKAVFVGDLVDRGPKTPAVLQLVMNMVKAGTAFCVPGNHDIKLLKWLNGKNVQLTHGLEESITQLMEHPAAFREEIKIFLDGLISHYVFDGGKLVVAHAGLREEMQGRGSARVREFCLYGETTGETDEFGLPVRYNWASEYKGSAMVVYGHTPVPEAQWLNRTIDIDTGCVFGGKLTALRYPEKELVSVPALHTYSKPVRPLLPPVVHTTSLQQEFDDVLDISQFLAKQIVTTNYGHNITIRQEHAIAALEVMSRFAINPKWLIYLPPTMSPAETSKLEAYLEYPAEAFDHFRKAGVTQVVCEEKHMGSRAIVVVGKNEAAITKAFGITNEGIGTVYTRTGRAYFTDKTLEQAFLQRINEALERAGFYEQFETDWVCLDTELMPWSAKAQSLLETQYGLVGAAAIHALHATVNSLEHTVASIPEAGVLLEKYTTRQQQVAQYIKAYQQYCWPVNSLDDYKLAPFHILATAGKTWTDKDHAWHMEAIRQLCAADPAFLLATPYKVVDVQDPQQVQEATDWWLRLTESGGEGMVVKPFQFIHRNGKGLTQPAIKIRGREYLRIIYGPEYTFPEHLRRLKERGLSGKRSLALREFVLGLEGLQRFVNKEPLQRVHECVFGVLALESEPVDPRL
ncbi:polynucleotide kinase-phosphatase [Chitinophaga agrisoli]|uniref:Polynucleotide kinase-phosphatase n=1 Tax=Chitinophaga agrisoli TaxID=2607653 RepID=A0A5B2VNV9_9BACT|nr:polynucleotide kinase-phosphatase [Chitinophaga agrisoli]KAA2240370.1 polynucleotide kinase-phosphatase [Chitinophaga agrisoli]